MFQFKACVILKREPYCVMCLSEKDAAELAKKEGDNVVLVLCSKAPIERNFPEEVIQLTPAPQKLLDSRETLNFKALGDEVFDQANKDLDKQLNKNLGEVQPKVDSGS